MEATWPPKQVTERFRIEGRHAVSFKTIYRWIYSGCLVRGVLQVLRHKGKRQKPEETRGKFAIGRTISDRPKEVRSRETFGHWELDTVVWDRGKSKGCVATLIERKTRLKYRCTHARPHRLVHGNCARCSDLTVSPRNLPHSHG